MMAATLYEPHVEANSTAQRKRRRRAAGGGAQDDCFACRKSGAACDRKRPYCTQCIQIGKECSGYKTTLTWGVGVASRGKLRGLSLPVASKSQADGKAEPKRRKSSVSTVSKPVAAVAHEERQRIPSIPIPNAHARGPTSAPTSWQPPTSGSSSSDYGPFGLASAPALRHIQTSIPSPLDGMTFPSSASSTGSYTNLDYHTPVEYAQSPVSFPDRLQQFSYVDDAAPSPLDHSPLTSLDMLSRYGNTYDASSVLATSYDTSLLGQLSDIDEHEYRQEQALLPYIDGRFSNHLFHLAPRLQTLIHYYDTSICPFLVAFDSPENPYRLHIIQLAAQNEGLQNALAALATNNMRMRRKDDRPVGFIEAVDDEGPSVEESRYKQMSIEQLNMQLTQPSAAQDDSVLATLLVLCLFHVCDSGFSKFKTQLAGVQKLMSLRDPSTKSAFTGWVEMFFIWFDVMTAAVNDREPQIKGESLAMMDYSVNLGALEQFSGCDGRLFKLIARLGGLSLLAQGRAASRTQGPMHSPPVMVPGLQKARSPLPRSLNAVDYEMLDGNGWGTPINAAPDHRTDFWMEWNDIRSRLQTWQVDASTFPQDPSGLVFDPLNLTPEQRDLVHISESFRHSALLYVERLAHPLLPSSASVFQNHVAQALYHISALPVTSCVNKFLLWPLFITGTECVSAEDRNIVRTRCIEIKRESGFYNNISCLGVLEKVWSDVDMGHGEEGEMQARRRDSEVAAGGESRQAFRWRRAMNKIDGEYLIV